MSHGSCLCVDVTLEIFATRLCSWMVETLNKMISVFLASNVADKMFKMSFI